MSNIIRNVKDAFGISKKITEEDIIKIRKADWETCARWWDIFNSWKWTDDLLPEESPQIKWSRNNRRHLLMDAIKNKVGEKYILRKLNVWKGSTEEEFEDFWNGIRNGDKEAYSRWQKGLIKRYPQEYKNDNENKPTYE